MPKGKPYPQKKGLKDADKDKPKGSKGQKQAPPKRFSRKVPV